MIAAVAMTALSAAAQETYENARLIEDDLNGTARYVGMGGAMDALGAEISTMSSNPAGVGMFRHSNISVSGGLVVQQGGADFRNGSTTNASFDQAGFVYSIQSNRKSYFNVGFNFHKSKNFDYILAAAAGAVNGSSQNALSFIKGIGQDRQAGTDAQGRPLVVSDYNFNQGNGTMYWTSQLDNLYYNAFIIDKPTGYPFFTKASGYDFKRANTGYIGEYDINLSGNINNRVYLGMTVGIHSVHYQGISEYTEQLIDIDGQPVGALSIEDDRRITGTGYSVAFGAIIRPVQNSPFRVGLSVATPTFYTLTTKNVTQLVNRVDPAQGYNPYNPNYVASGSYEFKMNTPWKFGLSLGHTVAQIAAIGAGIEYADYSHIDTREISGEYYDYWTDTYSTGSASDRQMNDHTDRTLKGVLTARIGAEIKPDPSLALRVGYNYVSPMYKSDGTKEFQIDSYGVNASSATDYTNWKATHRLTCGIGYRVKHFSIDLAYQYSVRDGDFYPYQNAWGDYHYVENNEQVTEKIDIISSPVSVSNKRHQVLMTLGYTF